MQLQEISKILNIEIISNIKIKNLKSIDEAKEDDITFFSDKKYIETLKTTKAGAILISKEFKHLVPKSCKILEVENAYLAMAIISKYFSNPLFLEDGNEAKIGTDCKIMNNVHLGKNVVIEDNVTLMSGCFIGDGVSVGSGTIIYPNVTAYNYTTIGKRVIIHAGSVIGSDGYGFAHTKMGEHVKIYHNGVAIIEDDVEIGANVTIDRAVFGKTIIKKGAKIDNLIQIAHNCEVGEHSLLASQVGLAGSTKLGRNVVMGGQSASAGHLEICDFTTIAGKGGVTKSIKEKGIYSGFPHMPIKKWLKLQAKLSRMMK